MPYFNYKDKRLYYEEAGSGFPLLLLHGNTASSNMFNGVVDLYKNDFTVVLLDFLGHGKSDRLQEFPADFWYDEALQAIDFLSCRHYGKVNLIGTSGGALVALNIALERSDLVNKVIADSFEGEQALPFVANIIAEDRQQSKLNEETTRFWQCNHGSDWESIIDNDTDVIIRHYKSIRQFFHKDLSQLAIPVMLTASLEDEYAGLIGLEETYHSMIKKIPNGKVHFFPKGGHPAMLSSAKDFFSLAKEFFY